MSDSSVFQRVKAQAEGKKKLKTTPPASKSGAALAESIFQSNLSLYSDLKATVEKNEGVMADLKKKIFEYLDSHGVVTDKGHRVLDTDYALVTKEARAQNKVLNAEAIDLFTSKGLDAYTDVTIRISGAHKRAAVKAIVDVLPANETYEETMEVSPSSIEQALFSGDITQKEFSTIFQQGKTYSLKIAKKGK